jgi:hypothetical protein
MQPISAEDPTMTTQDQSFTDQDPRLGGVDVDTWRAVPAEGNPDGRRTRAWNIVAGDYDDEPDVWITIEAEYPRDVAEFIVAAVRSAVMAGHNDFLPRR